MHPNAKRAADQEYVSRAGYLNVGTCKLARNNGEQLICPRVPIPNVKLNMTSSNSIQTRVKRNCPELFSGKFVSYDTYPDMPRDCSTGETSSAFFIGICIADYTNRTSTAITSIEYFTISLRLSQTNALKVISSDCFCNS